MKKLSYIIYTLLLSVLVFGCNEEDFLDEKPITELSTKSFFQNSNQFEQAVNGAYQGLQDLYDVEYWVMSGMRSDATTFQMNIQNQGTIPWRNVDQFRVNSSNGLISGCWSTTYSSIGKCNATLDYIADKDVENKARYMGEVKFLRAFYYFKLVQYFGDVPLVTKKIETYEEAFEGNTRTPKDQVYEQIISDLNDAKNSLPQSYTGEDQGRATEGAARTLLAKVLMWRDRYGDAATELEEVVNSGQYSLLEDYSEVFDINNENNEEMVFSVQYIEGPLGLGNAFMYRFLPWNSGSRYLPFPQQNGGTGYNIPTQDLMDNFENGDERLGMIDTTFIDPPRALYNDSIVPFTKKFMHPGHSQRLVTGSNFPVFRYPHVLLMLAECYARAGGGDPDPLVNMVRERSELTEISNVTLDDILRERMLEFYCEADRWDVLVRTGKAKAVMEAHGVEQRKRRFIKEDAYTNIKLLYPIPDDVIELDPGIKQNEEYL